MFCFTANLSTSYQMFVDEKWNEFGMEEEEDGEDSLLLPQGIPPSASYYFNMDYKSKSDAEDLKIARPPISCKPMPGTKIVHTALTLQTVVVTWQELYLLL